MSFEDELGEALRRTGNAFEGDPQAMLTASLARGRRIVRRRRAFAVTASVLAFGLLGTGAYAGGLLGREVDSVGVADADREVDSGRIFEIWRKLVPEGTFSRRRTLPREPGEFSHVSFVYDDGKGAGLVDFRMGVADPRHPEVCPPVSKKCNSHALPDGGRDLSVESHEAPYTTLDTKSVRRQVITKEGFFVEITVWNTPDSASRSGTRKVPVLMWELYRLPNANEWRKELREFSRPDPLEGEPPLDPGFVAPTGKISGADLADTLKSLLPQGTYGAEKSRGTADHRGPAASLVYDDGRGKAGVSAELYRVDPNGYSTRQFTSCRRVANCTLTTLADRSKVRVVRTEYGKTGGYRKFWKATYLSPEGNMVEISESNTSVSSPVVAPGDQLPARSRELPPLTVEQLGAVVSNAKWRAALDELPKAPDELTGGPTRPWGSFYRFHRESAHGPSSDPGAETCGTTCTSRLVLNEDGLGAGSVQVTMDRSKTNKSADVLLDVRQENVEGGGEGVIRWVVTGSLPGGPEVTLTAYNAPSPEEDATRRTPPLNLPTLKSIVLDPNWNNPRLRGSSPPS
ncbi:hypothetical protein V1460_26515 [Streptomyces sp. SCSIO 30461]|uniref:hypothetical protein n=1 Tax=Streptomyces sp. SCSIO 30461 TaxID=3118085 RepID=UPI0030CE125D